MPREDDPQIPPMLDPNQESLFEVQPMPPAPEPMIGVGPLAPGAYRFNWGAFLMPGLWGIVYGVWQFIALWMVSILLPFGVIALMGGSDTSTPVLSALIGSTVVSEAFVGIARLWSGMNANRLLWKREQLRLAIVPNAAPKHPIGKYLRRQRTWAYVGAVLLVPAIALNTPAAYAEWQKYSLGILAVIEPLVWLIAELALGAWLAYRMTIDGPDAPAPVEGTI